MEPSARLFAQIGAQAGCSILLFDVKVSAAPRIDMRSAAMRGADDCKPAFGRCRDAQLTTGPLAMGNLCGPGNMLEALFKLQTLYGDPRCGPSPWLRWRGAMRLTLLHERRLSAPKALSGDQCSGAASGLPTPESIAASACPISAKGLFRQNFVALLAAAPCGICCAPPAAAGTQATHRYHAHGSHA